MTLLIGLLRRRRGFPHPHSLPGELAASWQNGYYTRGRTDLPFPSPPGVPTSPARLRVVR